MTKELFEALDALCSMWSQYCPQPYGHSCMSAGENALDVLSGHGLIKNEHGWGGEVDYDKLEELKKQIDNTPT